MLTMESARAPMHLPDGSLFSISEMLATFPENGFMWVILEFFGTGQAPGGISMPEFEDRIRSADYGLTMTWAELKEFGAHVTQTFDCEIVAIREADDAAKPPGTDSAIAKICAFDSTQWYVSVNESLDEFRPVLSAVQRIAAGVD